MTRVEGELFMQEGRQRTLALQSTVHPALLSFILYVCLYMYICIYLHAGDRLYGKRGNFVPGSLRAA